MPSKKKKYNARFPAGRIKKIMQTDEEVGKVAQAVPVIISRTLELFVESLLTKAMEITSAKNAKTLTPTHMKQCILSEQRFDFLKDLVKSVQDSTNGEDDMPMMNPGILTPPPHRSVPERRKSSSSTSIKDEPVIKGEVTVKEEPAIKGEIMLKEEPAIKTESKDPAQVVANCSTVHLGPNFYTETMAGQRVTVHQSPVEPPYHDPGRINRSPILVMDEDYDT